MPKIEVIDVFLDLRLGEICFRRIDDYGRLEYRTYKRNPKRLGQFLCKIQRAVQGWECEVNQYEIVWRR